MSHADDDIGYCLIDPPVTAYSSPAEIERWLTQLHAMPRVAGVADAIEEAERMLAASRAFHRKDETYP